MVNQSLEHLDDLQGLTSDAELDEPNPSPFLLFSEVFGSNTEQSVAAAIAAAAQWNSNWAQDDLDGVSEHESDSDDRASEFSLPNGNDEATGPLPGELHHPF
jgi:hypothetical protein